jgi:hypothetical protein
MRSFFISIVFLFASISSANGKDCDVNLPIGATRIQLNSTLKCLQKSVDNLIPVGTIIASMLKPNIFADIIGDPDPFDSADSKWALADNKNVAGSEYAKKVDTKLPDLGGMFLRGINTKDGKEDPEGVRPAGRPQDDALQEHGHQTDARKHGWGKSGQGYTTRGGEAPKAEVTTVTGANAADETRPKNVAVYFYIKIN